MSRKNFDDIKQVIQINALRKNLDNWQIIDLNQLSHYDIAKTLNESSIFLSSNASNFVNGHTLYVDGGITASL